MTLRALERTAVAGLLIGVGLLVVDAIEHDRPPQNDGRSALLVHDLIDAVLASSRVHAPIAVRQRTP